MYHEYQIHQKHYLLLIGERKFKITLGRLLSLRLCLHKHFNESMREHKVGWFLHQLKIWPQLWYFIPMSNYPNVDRATCYKAASHFPCDNWQHFQERHLNIPRGTSWGNFFQCSQKSGNTPTLGSVTLLEHACFG